MSSVAAQASSLPHELAKKFGKAMAADLTLSTAVAVTQSRMMAAQDVAPHVTSPITDQ